MARTIPDDTANNAEPSRASNRSRRRTDCLSLPYSSHPFFQIRRAISAIAIIGIICCFLGSPYWYYGGVLYMCSMLLGLSLFLCLLDLLCYARKKKDDPDSEPQRPTGKWTLVDLLMALLLQITFWTALVALMDHPYGYDRINVLGAWGVLAVLLCSSLHACSFYKQWMRDKEKQWRAKLKPAPCDRCGYVEETSDPPSDERPASAEHPNVFTYAGPSASFRRSNILTPESPESAMEEGLLIGSDFGSNYGSVDRSQYEPVLESPEEIVVGKGKKKAKSVSGQKGSTKSTLS